ncbi:hypothetical protein ElyMa_001805800 [Elysia marginata]|uniref:FHA domain-containing protein n=1 Tax=Elysia marginata TaxID=1093978 RepID=A0AAV4EGV6_9GAST|nr:hypothetical protein ElyMa_001805800 [Elysia marginata]
MAQPPPYPTQGAYPPPQGQQPPPAYAYVPPPQAQGPPPAAAANQAPPKQQKNQAPPKQQKKSGGMFSSFMKEMDKVGKQISKEIDYASAKVNETVDQHYSSALLDMFKNGNSVQLISRLTGRCVQIVIDAHGLMVLDANGVCDPNAFNSVWIVTNEGNNQVRLHNSNNYLAIENGHVIVKPFASGSVLGPETKFQLSQTQFQFVTLESLNARGEHVGFLPTGQVKPAKGTIKDNGSMFGVKLVASSYPQVTVVKK